MMFFRKTITSILCWFICSVLAAQSSGVDSLSRILASGETNGVEKVEEESCENTLVEDNNGMEMMEGLAYAELGRYYMSVNKYYLAHVNFKMSEKLLLGINARQQLYHLYRDLSTLFSFINDRDNGLYYTNKQLEIAVEINDPAMILAAKSDLGWGLFKNNLGQEEVLNYFLDLYQKSILLNEPKYINGIGSICGMIYVRLNSPREALPYLHMGRKYSETGEQSGKLALNYYYLAEAHSKLRRRDSAMYYINKARNVSKIENDTKLDLLRLSSTLDSIRGNFRSALISYQKYHHLSDSISKSLNTKEIALMRNWYDLEQKDHENEILQQEIQKQQTLIMILAGVLAFILFLLASSIFLNRRTSEKNRELKKLHTVKDKVFSVVAHDLRNPMGALIAVLKLANKAMLDAEAQANLLKDIACRVDDTYSLLDNLLHWSKSQMQGIAPSPVFFNIHDETRAVVDSLRDIAAAKKISLYNHIGNQIVYADRDMLNVVVRNLTTNAIKYTSAEGEVTLSSELSGDMNMLIVSVKDNGTGISPLAQEQLFKLSEARSRRGTKNESGAGMGLVLCADFVKINGGSIWCTSKIGEGSTFFFSVPVNSR